ncbi:hypothetical protein PAPYR_7032 [Paratrimastix pyriformis]|uniref:Uncharacterized protein n=1 Tax=Paratrimastix pyriformis TaxID=342808 RepID=A0ABQ8UFB5_9EUKA|nr:hypothetical protein PAPYR_7032 [Paratrimastix pyriformis]
MRKWSAVPASGRRIAQRPAEVPLLPGRAPPGWLSPAGATGAAAPDAQNAPRGGGPPGGPGGPSGGGAAAGGAAGYGAASGGAGLARGQPVTLGDMRVRVLRDAISCLAEMLHRIPLALFLGPFLAEGLVAFAPRRPDKACGPLQLGVSRPTRSPCGLLAPQETPDRHCQASLQDHSPAGFSRSPGIFGLRAAQIQLPQVPPHQPLGPLQRELWEALIQGMGLLPYDGFAVPFLPGSLCDLSERSFLQGDAVRLISLAFRQVQKVRKMENPGEQALRAALSFFQAVNGDFCADVRLPKDRPGRQGRSTPPPTPDDTLRPDLLVASRGGLWGIVIEFEAALSEVNAPQLPQSTGRGAVTSPAAVARSPPPAAPTASSTDLPLELAPPPASPTTDATALPTAAAAGPKVPEIFDLLRRQEGTAAAFFAWHMTTLSAPALVRVALHLLTFARYASYPTLWAEELGQIMLYLEPIMRHPHWDDGINTKISEIAGKLRALPKEGPRPLSDDLLAAVNLSLPCTVTQAQCFQLDAYTAGSLHPPAFPAAKRYYAAFNGLVETAAFLLECAQSAPWEPNLPRPIPPLSFPNWDDHANSVSAISFFGTHPSPGPPVLLSGQSAPDWGYLDGLCLELCHALIGHIDKPHILSQRIRNFASPAASPAPAPAPHLPYLYLESPEDVTPYGLIIRPDEAVLVVLRGGKFSILGTFSMSSYLDHLFLACHFAWIVGLGSRPNLPSVSPWADPSPASPPSTPGSRGPPSQGTPSQGTPSRGPHNRGTPGSPREDRHHSRPPGPSGSSAERKQLRQDAPAQAQKLSAPQELLAPLYGGLEAAEKALALAVDALWRHLLPLPEAALASASAETMERLCALVLIKQRDDKARVRTIFPDGWLAYWRAHETGGDHPPPSLLEAEMTVLQAITGGQQNLLGSDEAVNLLGSAVPASAGAEGGLRDPSSGFR